MLTVMLLRDLTAASSRSGRILARSMLSANHRELLGPSLEHHLGEDNSAVAFVMHLSSRAWQFAVGVNGSIEVVALMQAGVAHVSHQRAVEANVLGRLRDAWRLLSSLSTS